MSRWTTPRLWTWSRASAMVASMGKASRRSQRAGPAETRGQGLTVDELLDDVVTPDVVDGNEGGMGEKAHHLGLPLQAQGRARVRREGWLQGLDRDLAPGPGVVGSVDAAHRSLAQEPSDLVGSDPCRKRGGSCRRSPVSGSEGGPAFRPRLHGREADSGFWTARSPSAGEAGRPPYPLNTMSAGKTARAGAFRVRDGRRPRGGLRPS